MQVMMLLEESEDSYLHLYILKRFYTIQGTLRSERHVM
jgi:hypothetical protein